MAYQPKYSRKEEKKPIKWGSVLAGLAAVPLSVVLTLGIFTRVAPELGRPAAAASGHEKTGNQAMMDKFDTFITNGKSDALEGVLAVKKRFWLSEDTQVAPEPIQTGYGEAGSPEELRTIIEQAASLLEGQDLYFGPETKIFEGSPILYYLDESILAITWKEVHDGSVYTFSEVKVSHPSQFRRHLAGGEYGSEMQFMTTEMAESVNAVVASSGDFYRFRDFGTSVYEGTVRRVEGTFASTCYIDKYGDLHFTYGGEIMNMKDAQQYVDDNEITFSLAFGPVMVDNYVRCEPDWYGVGEVAEEYARAALCQMGSLHYLLVTANREGPYQNVPNVHTFAKNIHATGCKMAYCLDGGQTAAIVMNDQLINRVVYGYQRKISDIIYFASAVPDGG